MTDSPPDPTDGTNFTEALAALIEGAARNGIDVEGGWKVISDGNGTAYWDVQITGVEYEETDDP